MFGWLERLKRVDTLEQEVAALRSALAEATAGAAREAGRASGATERLDGIDARVAALGERFGLAADRAAATAVTLAAIEKRLKAIVDRFGPEADRAAATLAAHEERLAAVERRTAGSDDAEARAATDREELARLQLAVRKLEQQLRLHAEEAGRTATALLERVERARIAAVAPPPAP